jgi:hypothetical protein
MGIKQKHFFEKRIQNGRLKKTEFFKINNSAKNSWIWIMLGDSSAPCKIIPSLVL